jgi:uncharacterized protein
MGLGRRVTDGINRLYDRSRHPTAFKVTRAHATSASFDVLRGNKYGLLVTFRRTGEPVPSPVWMAVDGDGRVYVETGADSAKVKRVRRDPSVLIAASTVRGRPTGPVLLGTARVLAKDEVPHAERTLAGGFGLGRKVYRKVFPASPDQAAYLEVVAAED